MGSLTLKFNRLYTKLEGRWFNTIQQGDQGLQVGDTVTIQTPRSSFQVCVRFVKETLLKDIPTSTLTYDTDTTTDEEALKHLQIFYPGLNWYSTVYLIGFERVGVG